MQTSPRSPRCAIALGVALATAGCGGGGSQELSGQGDYQDLFWEFMLPFAEVLSELADEPSMLVPHEGPEFGSIDDRSGPLSFAAVPTVVGANPANCPGGGTVGHDSFTGATTLVSCEAAGVTVNGMIGTILSGDAETGYTAMISAGNLEIAGAFEGSVAIMSGNANWAFPVEDESTFWELRIFVDGQEVCIWSGAETGPCMGV